MTKIIGFFEAWLLMVAGFTFMLSLMRLITNGFDFKNLIESFRIKLEKDKVEGEMASPWAALLITIFIVTGIISALVSFF